MIEVPVRVKDALREGCYRKNYRMVVYQANGETIDFTIDNNNLINESVQIDERMCSDSEIKFGLCEGTYLDFQCFDVPNITGRRLKLYIDVEYKDEHGDMLWHPITLGWFDVKKCSKNPDTGRIKISCYNKLLSDYLSQKANAYLLESITETQTLTMFDIIHTLLSDYQIEQDYDKLPINEMGGYTYNPSYQLEWVIQNAYFEHKYGVDTPLNYYMAENYVSSIEPYYVGFIHRHDTLQILQNVDYDRILFKIKDGYKHYEAVERATYNAMIKTIDDAQLIDGNGNRITGQSVVDSLLSSHNWYRFFSVQKEIKKEISAGQYETQYITYSTILYEYCKEHDDMPPNPLYPFNDLFNVSHKNYDDTQIMDFDIYTTIGYGLFKGQATVTDGIGYLFDGTRNIDPHGDMPELFFDEYTYYTTSDISESGPIETNDTTVYHYETGQVIDDTLKFDVYGMYIEDQTPAEMVEMNIATMPDFTLRDLINAVYETTASYGRLNRESDLFAPMELNNARLLPAEGLYPANDLYPISLAERINRAMYEKLWCDEGDVRKFRYLRITYKTTEEQQGQTVEVEKVLQRTVDEHGTDNYNCSDNWLFKNLIWTAEQIGEYADAMVEKMRNLTWFPFELWCAGLPYIETGDEVEINMNGNAYTSYVLKRNLTGIQDLHDEMMNGNIDTF